MTSDYRLARPVVVRMMGAALMLAGLAVVLVGLVGAVLSWPGTVLAGTVVVAGAGVLAVALVLARRSVVVRLDESGYAVRWVRGAGVKEGRWKDVEDVVADVVGGARCVVLRRRDGSTTTIPVSLLAVPDGDFVQDLKRHLDRGHGYRPLR